MYRLAIIEDDPAQLEAIEHLLERFPRCGELSVFHLAGAGELESYLAAEPDARIDILLTDIMLGDQEPDGIQLVQRHFPPGCGTQVVYLTGHLQYCTKVYRTEHVYFLAKPVEQQDFDDALDKALANLSAVEARPLLVRSKGSVVPVMPSSISYIESLRRKVCIHAGGEAIETYASLGELSQKLPESFIQCHKSFLVNMDHIVELGKEDVRLQSGESVPVSQKRRKTVREAFFSHLRARL